MSVVADTAPIEFRDLVDDQREAIRKVHRALRSMHADRWGESEEGDDTWPTIFPNRSHRVIVLDGPRGTGKTALLLTLLRGWRRDARRVSDRSEVEREFFDGMGEHVRATQILDFYPLPKQLHPYTLFVQSFRKIVAKLDRGEEQEASPWSAVEGREPSLYEEWRHLHRAAQLGWQPTGSTASDAEEYVVDEFQRQGGWLDLADQWRRFVNRLISTMERRELLPKGALLVLPVDDLDLCDRIADDLLLAIRRVSHPRLVVVLTGHVRNLEETIQRRLVDDSMKDPERLRREEEARLRGLGADLVAKAMPPSLRIQIGGLTLTEALRVSSGFDRHDAEAAAAPEVGDRETLLRSYLEYEGEAEGLLRVRDVVQVFASGEAPSDLRAHATNILELTHDPDTGGKLFRAVGRSLVWEHLPSDSVAFVWTQFGGFTTARFLELTEPSHDIHHTTPADRPQTAMRLQPRGRILARGQRGGEDVADVELPRPRLHQLLYVEAAGRLVDFERLDVAESFAASVNCYLPSGLQLSLPLPTATVLRSGFDHDLFSQKWNEAIPVGSRGGVDPTLWYWIWFCIGMPTTEIDEGEGLEVLTRGLTKRRWERLLRFVANRHHTAPGREPSGGAEWAFRALPRLAAPEYGLSESTQRLILEWARKSDRSAPWDVICRELSRERRLALMRSVGFYSHITATQAARSWGESHDGALESAVGLVQRELEESFPGSVWSQLVEQRSSGDSSLLSMPVRPGKTVAHALSSRQGEDQVPSREFDGFPRLRDLFINSTIRGERPNWAARAVGSVGGLPTLRRDIGAVFEDYERATISAAELMQRAWALLVRQFVLRDSVAKVVEAWIRCPDALQLEYCGPTFSVRATEVNEVTVGGFTLTGHEGWAAERPNEVEMSDRDWDSLAAWLLLCQSFSGGRSFDAISVVPADQLRLGDNVLEAPKARLWNVQEANRSAWNSVLDFVKQRAPRAGGKNAPHSPEHRWILANWLTLGIRTLTRGIPGAPLNYPLTLAGLRGAAAPRKPIPVPALERGVEWAHAQRQLVAEFDKSLGEEWHSVITLYENWEDRA